MNLLPPRFARTVVLECVGLRDSRLAKDSQAQKVHGQEFVDGGCWFAGPRGRLYVSILGGEEMSLGIAVAVIPEEYYRKPKGVQFKKSYRMRENAIRYAEEHGCRVVIACKNEDRYDVLCDPCSIPGPKVNFELVVDRGELIAVPRVPPDSELLALSSSPVSDSGLTSPKLAWNLVNSWLNA
jgi:hypothetical protein